MEEADFIVEAAVREELFVWEVEVSSGEKKELDLGVAILGHLGELFQAVKEGSSSTSLENNLERINEKARLREDVAVQVLVRSGTDNSALDFVEHVLPFLLVLGAHALGEVVIFLELDFKSFCWSLESVESFLSSGFFVAPWSKVNWFGCHLYIKCFFKKFLECFESEKKKSSWYFK